MERPAGMTVTPEGYARGAFVAMVLAGASLHPDAVRLVLRLTDEQLASALALGAEWTARCAGERFSIRQYGPGTHRHASSEGLYSALDAVSTAIIVTALVAEME